MLTAWVPSCCEISWNGTLACSISVRKGGREGRDREQDKFYLSARTAK